MPAQTPSAAREGARERVLGAARTLFYARGLRAVGVDAIIAESGVAKATFYKHFPSKDDLIVAYLEAEAADLDAAWQEAARKASDGAARLEALFVVLCERSGAAEHRGYGVVNAAAESAPDTRAHEHARRHASHFRERLTALAGEAGASNPQELAATLELIAFGAFAYGAVHAGDAGALVAHDLARTAIKDAIKGAPAKKASAKQPSEKKGKGKGKGKKK